MQWLSAMIARANAHAPLTALIGANKVYPENAPQTAALPYVTLFDVSQDRPQTMKGWDIEFARVQIDVWARSYVEKNTIMEAVLAALVPGGTFGGHVFQRAEIALGPRDVGGEREGETIIYRKSADLVVAHKPAA